MNETTPIIPLDIQLLEAGTKPVAMITSTTVDLPEHRHEAKEACLRAGYFPLMMEYGSAEWNSDAIKFSLEKVDAALVYIGIFAFRYGHIPTDTVRNPHKVSITELEYRHADIRKIPLLCFLASDDHLFKPNHQDTDAEKIAKLKKFKDGLSGSSIRAKFLDKVELRERIYQSLMELKAAQPKPVQPAATKPTVNLPTPPKLYAVPNYTLTSKFIGRTEELTEFDAWARSDEPIMVVEGIGGLGKSAVTWEWAKNYAATVMPNFAGAIWWSFYEKGTSMVTFVRHALAYVTRQDPDSDKLLRETSHLERGAQLLAELQQHPYLLVLDGFERVLTAYNQYDAGHIPDDLVDDQLRDCINPKDGDLLQQLLACSPSKILISTRLFPTILQDRGGKRPADGVVHHKLNGLKVADALELMTHAGITGNRQAMLEFANEFGRHSLVLKIVCGLINEYRRKPGDFDAWKADPNYGGSLKLADLDLKQKYTHILHFALKGLNDKTKTLLGRIAILSEGVDDRTLTVLNPFATIGEFDAALKELEDRGLVQWDRHTNSYDMHPVVCGHAKDMLQTDDRIETLGKVRNHLEKLPLDNFETATELSQLKNSIEIYWCFVRAKELDAAAEFYQGEFSDVLFFNIGAYRTMEQMLRPFFGSDTDGLPQLRSKNIQSYILFDWAFILHNLGRLQSALTAHAEVILFNFEEQYWEYAGAALRSLSINYIRLNHRAQAAVTLDLARELAEVANDEDGTTMAIFLQTNNFIRQGQFVDANKFDVLFRQRKQPSINLLSPGGTEYWRSFAQFYQSQFTVADWEAGFELTTKHRNVFTMYKYLALKAEWLLEQGEIVVGLEAIDQALAIINKLGSPEPGYHDLRAWALAALGRKSDALLELAKGERQLFAAEAYCILGDVRQACECALNCYLWAWGEGPPHIEWYHLQRSKKLLEVLGEPVPVLPPFDPSKVPPIPHEDKIRAAIAELKAKKNA
jgi:tetratricopeptide (TPR) repeat protein